MSSKSVRKLSEKEAKLSMLSFCANVASEIKGSIKNSRTQIEVILEKMGLHALEDMELPKPWNTLGKTNASHF